MGRSMIGQRRPSSTTMVTLVTTTQTATETTTQVLKPIPSVTEENPDIWHQYLEQYILPFAGTAVAIIAIKTNDSLVNWLVGILLFNFIKINPSFLISG